MDDEKAIEILTEEIAHIKNMIYPQDMETTWWVENRIEAIEKGIDALQIKIDLKSSPCYNCSDKNCTCCLYNGKIME